jgi:hypothetical protein
MARCGITMTFRSLEEEHQHFLKAYPNEKRWQLVLEHRRIALLKQQALRDWSYDHPVEVSTQSMPVSEQPKVVNNPTIKEIDFIDYKTPQVNKSAF